MHHEHLNGAGYPHGLKGKDIPLAVRIVTVADVYESMQSHRPYRPAKSDKEAIQELKDNAGKLYDKKVVAACLALLKKGTFQFSTIKTATELWKK